MASQICNSCNKPALNQCKNCKLVYYCCNACQKKDWKKHKLFCKNISINNNIMTFSFDTKELINHKTPLFQLLNIGEKLFINKKYPEALSIFMTALEYDTFDESTESVNINHLLGVIYFQGLGTYIDYDKAIYHCKKAADKNHYDSQYNLALIYKKLGNNLEELKYLNLAADNGVSDAMVILARSYENGNNILAQNSEMAEYYYKKSADLNNFNGIVGLGLYYLKQDDKLEESIKVFKKGNDIGCGHSSFLLGQIYAQIGNRKLSQKYYDIAKYRSQNEEQKKEIDDMIKKSKEILKSLKNTDNKKFDFTIIHENYDISIEDNDDDIKIEDDDDEYYDEETGETIYLSNIRKIKS